MKYINIMFSLLMLAFVIVQYNDPDIFYWGFIYFIPAFFSGTVGLYPQIFRKETVKISFVFSTLLIIFLTGFYWPKEPNWFLVDIWWEKEIVREGMGMMISSFVMIFSALTLYKLKRI